MKNRELKFRAWTGAKMKYDVMVGRFGVFYVNPMDNWDGLDPNDSASLTPFNTIYGKETPIMQWTGLLDKNGQEIWEGDVLKYEYQKKYYIGRNIKNGKDIGAKYSEEPKDFYSIYEVLWFNGTFEVNCSEYSILLNGWATKYIFDNLHLSEKTDPYEFGEIRPLGIEFETINYGAYGKVASRYTVIGNIYENPELIK